MTKKLLFKLLLLLFCFNYSYSQVTDFITTGLDQPNRLIIDNNIIYVKGIAAPGEIVEIDLNSFTPSANTLFNSLPVGPDPFEIGSIIKNGNLFYLSYVNVNTGESTLASFDINTPNTLDDIVTGLGYVAAIDLYNDELYFTDEDLSGGGITLKKINITISNPPVNDVVSGLTNPQDMEFNGNILYIGDKDAGGSGMVYSVDVSAGTPMLNSFITNANARGVYVYNEFLYYSDAGVIKKAPFSNPSNITTEAIDNDGDPEFLRDVVIAGTNLYMPQETSNKIVTKEDLTLSSNRFLVSSFSLYPNPARENFKIKLGSNVLLEKVNIYNIQGKYLFSSNNNKINVTNFKSGVYFIEVKTNKGKATEKLIIK